MKYPGMISIDLENQMTFKKFAVVLYLRFDNHI